MPFLAGLHLLLVCCSSSAATFLWTAETPVLHGEDKQCQSCSRGAGNGYQRGTDRFSSGLKQWDSSCNRSSILARAPPDQFGTSLPVARTAVGSLVSSCAGLSCSHQDCVSPWVTHTSEYPESEGEAVSSCQLFAVCQDRGTSVAQLEMVGKGGRELQRFSRI